MSQTRFSWLLPLSIAFAATSLAVDDGPVAGPKSLMIRDVFDLDIDHYVRVKVESNEVELRDGRMHPVVYVNGCVFHLEDGLHLTARLSASDLEYHTAAYDIHAAVFDSEGHLLGTAKAVYEIEKAHIYWSGGGAFRGIQELELDFGISRKYGRARHFSLSISEPDVPPAEQPTAGDR